MTPAFAPADNVALRRGKVLIATTNPNKLREIRPLLEAPLQGGPYQLVTLADLEPVAEPEETGATFWQNARIKALAYAEATGLVTVAEDSGFEIDELGGEPGVRSARFGHATATYDERFAEIYRRLAGRRSTARFVTALVLARGREVLFETETSIEGEVAEAPRGQNGFGYDPIFWYPPFGRTTAELTDHEKALVSHRARAFRDLLGFLRNRSLIPDP